MQPYALSRARTYPAGVARTFDLVLPTPLPGLFCHRRGPIPPIKEVHDDGKPWGTVGQIRTIVLTDGGRMRETLTGVDRPAEFGYRIDVLKGPLKALVAGADGRWSFEQAGTGVRITWTWSITPTSGLAARLMPVLGHYWQGYAALALEELEGILLPAS